MAFSQRFWALWVIISVFFILICLKLESKDGSTMKVANWFTIFLPLFLVDFCQFCLICHNIYRRRTSNTTHNFPRFKQSIEYFCYLVCLVLFKILLCFRLNQKSDEKLLKLYFVFIPLWLFLISFSLKCSHALLKARNCNLLEEFRNLFYSNDAT